MSWAWAWAGVLNSLSQRELGQVSAASGTILKIWDCRNKIIHIDITSTKVTLYQFGTYYSMKDVFTSFELSPSTDWLTVNTFTLFFVLVKCLLWRLLISVHHLYPSITIYCKSLQQMSLPCCWHTTWARLSLIAAASMTTAQSLLLAASLPCLPVAPTPRSWSLLRRRPCFCWIDWKGCWGTGGAICLEGRPFLP